MMFVFTKNEITKIIYDHFIVFYALGFLIVGVLTFEDKVLFFGIPWTWFALLFGWFFIIWHELLDYKKILLISKFFILLLLIFISISINYVFISDGQIDYDDLAFHIPTLFLTSCTVFVLATKVNTSRFFILTDRFCLIICFVLLVARLITQDFTRMGTFIGLGPLTFIKYISLGVLIRFFYIKKWPLIPLMLYLFAFFVANSRGPTLYILITMLSWTLINLNFKRAFTLFPVFILVLFLLSYNDRMLSLFEELQTFPSIASSLEISNSEIADESVSGVIARVYSIKVSGDLIYNNPVFGIGPGQWPEASGLEMMAYPHNSLLEIWSEYGFFAFLIFIIILFNVIKEFFKKNPHSILALFAFMTTLSSGSIRDLRFLAFLILMTFFFKILEKRRVI